MAAVDPPTAGLPLLVTAWLADLLDGPVPAETKATCHDCAMLPPADGPLLQTGHYFNPNVKCCSYIPALPNFLVGRILADEQPELARGRQSTLVRLQNAALANPLWLEMPSIYNYNYNRRKAFFGRLDEMVCPHYVADQGGLCGIWQHRNGVCATWFCKHVRGAVGHRFWQALRELLAALERDLARWCALRLEIPPETVRDLSRNRQRVETIHLLEVEQSQPNLSTAALQTLWGRWHGQEQAYYVACGKLVETLSWDEVLAACGPEVEALARLVQQAHRQLRSNEAPARLRPGRFKVVAITETYVIAESYLGSDLLKIPRRIFDLLPRFDGRPTPEVITGIALTTGLKVSPSLVRKLVDFEILMPVTEEV